MKTYCICYHCGEQWVGSDKEKCPLFCRFCRTKELRVKMDAENLAFGIKCAYPPHLEKVESVTL